jgi:hypothetical protein
MTDRESEQVKVAETPDPKWEGAGEGWGCPIPPLFPCTRSIAGSYGDLERRILWNWGTPRPLGLETGRENASVWEGGRRQRSSPRPTCNALDMVKVCQESEEERQDCLCGCRGYRRGLCP